VARHGFQAAALLQVIGEVADHVEDIAAAAERGTQALALLQPVAAAHRIGQRQRAFEQRRAEAQGAGRGAEPTGQPSRSA
jgi:hypothetical protein